MQSIKLIFEKYRKTKDIKKLAESAKELLEAEGLVKLPIGSYWRWIHTDWLNKALEEKVLFKNAHGQFVPVVDVKENIEIIGKRGRNDITKKVEKLDYSRFLNFVDKYNKFLYAQEMEGQRLMSI